MYTPSPVQKSIGQAQNAAKRKKKTKTLPRLHTQLIKSYLVRQTHRNDIVAAHAKNITSKNRPTLNNFTYLKFLRFCVTLVFPKNVWYNRRMRKNKQTPINTDKLKQWTDLLLDTGKRNNLINFTDGKGCAVEILSPDIATLFNRLEGGAALEVYDPKLANEAERFELADDETEKITKNEYIKAYAGKLKKQQLLIYNPANTPIVSLKHIAKKAKTSIDETGVNIAYLALGFIRWTEGRHSHTSMHAPLLLVPIKIESESSVAPLTIKAIDDVIVNPTFDFKLQQEYGIRLPEFDADKGVNDYLSKVKKLVAKLRWTVETECKISIFSFLKINMYRDLKDNAQTVLKNENVKALLGEPSNTTDEQPPNVGYSQLHNVVDADCSQADAIITALQGKSFVLQGPPGTGKSQTITNIIAECLLAGKTVLFVSEKLAALKVVYEKLKNVGLEEFCLELHSHKTNKKQVIDELCHTLRLPKATLSEQVERELEAKREAQATLDSYAVELHTPHPVVGKSVYAMYEELSALRSVPDLDFAITNIENCNKAYFEQAQKALDKYVELIPEIGYDYRNNAWYGYRKQTCSYQDIVQLKQQLQSVAELCHKLKKVNDVVNNIYGIRLDTLRQSHTFNTFAKLCQTDSFITPALLNAERLHEVTDAVRQMQKLSERIAEKQAWLDKQLTEDIYRLNGELLHQRLTKYRSVFSRAFSKEYKQIIHDIKFCKKDNRLSRKKAIMTADVLRQYQQACNDFASLDQRVHPALGDGYNGTHTDFDSCLILLNKLSELHAAGLTFGKLTSATNAELKAEKTVFAKLLTYYDEIFAAKTIDEQALCECFDATQYDLQIVSLDKLRAKCIACQQAIEGIDTWCELTKLLQQIKQLNLLDYLHCAIDKGVKPNRLTDTYKKVYYRQWVDIITHKMPTLSALTRITHDATVQRFKQKDRLNFEINRALIKATLSAKRPSAENISQGSELAVLLRESEKKRKQKNVRTLLSEIGNLSQLLKPCFLMSPLSVSTYLSPDMQFDVVIFDEASQIFPQDAIGAIYRGKQLIVVGDSRQMPPSSFFSSSAMQMDDEGDELTDYESILDLCSTALPQRRLKWHYRSRFEQLIAFSNKSFYDNDLITFPSTVTQGADTGVDYVYVKGTFDRRTKTNRAEAEKIVDMVFEHISKHPERSLGVVAFSAAQQGLIDRLITKRRQRTPSKEYFFKSDKPEPFFVKNLETVQGDERDTIIFSVAYARDAQGKLLTNFGPINREGGERRLNVAVTRAKYNIKLVTSLHHTDINLGGSKSVGAGLLRDYLDYAENGSASLQKSVARNAFDSETAHLQSEICEFLREKGYSVTTQVGSSAFKIDIAVRHPENGNYILAIECDGYSYNAAKVARDRDRLRQDVLESMGWQFYRIWSVDWFRSKRAEKAQLLAAVKATIDAASKTTTTNSVATHKSQVKQVSFAKYVMADEHKLARACGNNVLQTTLAILKVEAPLSEEWLLRRISFLFNREKVTNVVREEFDNAMLSCHDNGIIRRDGFLYLADNPITPLRVPTDKQHARDIKYIAIEELSNGLIELLKQGIGDKNELFSSLAANLGFSKITPPMQARLEAALKALSDAHSTHTN